MTTPRAVLVCLVLLSCVLALQVRISAQNIYASVTGTVIDDTGAVIPGVSITIVNTGTGLTRSVITDERGGYVVTSLPIGTYSISAELTGFKKEVRSGIVLQVDQRAREDFQLKVGQVSEVLEVTAAAPLVQSETSSVGNVIDNRKVVELPLNGRDFNQLALLVPGSLPTAQGSTHSSRGGFNVAGAREVSNNFLLDGVDNNSNVISNFTLKPSVEIIQEFKVQSNAYSAESGRFSGGQINVTTKAGTNDFHGSVFEFIRNSALDAKNFFDKPNDRIPPFKRNQFGGSLGGPIQHDRTFFFGAFEGIRIRQSQTLVAAVPEPAMRGGNFSALLVPGNPWTRTPRQLVDPITRQVFAGNIIPANRIDPIGAKIAATYPLPNLSDPIRNFVSSAKSPNDVNQYNLRIDHKINDAHSVFARYSVTKDILLDGFDHFTNTTNLPGYGMDQRGLFQNAAIVYTIILNPKLVNELRLGYVRFHQDRLPEDKSDAVSLFGIKGTDPTGRVGVNRGFPLFRVTGYDPVGGGSGHAALRFENNYQIVDNISYNRGAHAFKSGLDLIKYQWYGYQPSNIRGNYQFNGTYSGFALADLLLGYPNQAAREILLEPNQNRYNVHSMYAFYVQDDWRIAPALTLNLGLRYELDMPIRDVFNRVGRFDPKRNVIEIARVKDQRYDPSRLPVLAVPVVIRNSDTVWDADKNNFAPRFGLAWRPFNNNRTVWRAGYGIFYDSTMTGNEMAGFVLNNPFRVPETFNGDLTRPNLTLSDPFPTSAGLTPLEPSGIGELQLPYVQQFNLGIQHELRPDFVVEVGYVGSKGTKLRRQRNINQAIPGAGTVDSRRPFKGFGNINYRESSASSSYHSLQLRLEKRFSHGLSFLSSYTFGKSIDNDSGTGGTGSPRGAQNEYNLRPEKARSTFDSRHAFTFSYVYELPIGSGRAAGANWPTALRQIVSGWQFSGIVTLTTGRPFTPIISRDNSGTGQRKDRPDLTGDPRLDNPDPSQWVNAAAFAVPATGRFGNAGRNILTGPGINNMDFSLARNQRIREKQNIQFRAELFNALNHPNFLLPNNLVDSPQFGKIFGAGPSRQIQFGLRYVF